MEKRQTIANPFNRSIPNRPNPSPFAKWPNATPAKKRTMSTKPRKVKVRNYTPINWVGQGFLTPPKATEAMPQVPTVQTQQMEAPFTFTKSVTASATNTAITTTASSPPIMISSQTQQRSNYCATCTPLGRQCPTTYPMSLNPNWSDSEGEEIDRDGDKQKEKEEKEKEQKELKPKDKNYFPPSPKYMPNSPSDTDDILTPELTNTLVLISEERQKEEQRKEKDTKDYTKINSKTDYNLDDTIDNIM